MRSSAPMSRQLDEVDWPAVAATDFRRAEVKEGKQAEFLVHEPFHGSLVERIGVISQGMAQQVVNAMRGAAHRPRIEIRRGLVLLSEGGAAMIEYRTGDILQADAEALVNTVNCVGIMGRGVALQFKNAYPENFRAYEAACAREGGAARADVRV